MCVITFKMQKPQLAELFAAFFRIGLTSFGMAILQNLKVMTLRRRFLSEQTFKEGLALVQLYPGPIMVDLVAFIGYRNHGVLGALAATIGYLGAGPTGALAATFAMFAPSFAMTLIFTELFAHVRHLGTIRGAIRGVMAVFVGLLAGITLSLGQQALTQPMAFVFAAAGLVALRYLKWDMLVVLAGGLLAWGGWSYLEATIGKL